jgi:hypothetical protein
MKLIRDRSQACGKSKLLSSRRLQKGRKFHLKIQSEWEKEALGDIKKEKGCIKPSGRRGRIDIHAQDNEDKKLVACVEIKNTNWDKIDKKRIAAYVNRQANQVWDYIESELEKGKEVSAGIIYPRMPRSKSRLVLVVKLFDERGIPVVWTDENIAERRNRQDPTLIIHDKHHDK